MKKTKIEVCTRTETAAVSRAEAAVADLREKRILAVKAAIELRVAMGMRCKLVAYLSRTFD